MQNNQFLNDLFLAYYDARKNKRKTINQLEFEVNLEKNIFDLYEDLITDKYQINPCIYFINNYPVKREIFAGDFRDRVVHHLIYNYVYDIFDKYFIYDSYSCRTWKWTSFWIKRISKFIRSCSDNYSKDCYILKLDISGYFMNINKVILFDKIKSILDNKQDKLEINYDFLLKLIQKVVFHDNIKNAIFKGKRADYVGLPKNKSLFFAQNWCWLPIGNLTSQLFSNVYLDWLDKYIKKELKIKYYWRYVDDFVIIHPNKNELTKIIDKISQYLSQNLWLTLHPDKIYLQHFSKWVSFLWNIIKPNRNYTRKRTFWNFYKKIEKINKSFNLRPVSFLETGLRSKVLSPINSYLGFTKNTPSFKIRQKILLKLDKKLSSFIFTNLKFNKIKINYGKLPKFTRLQDELWPINSTI